MMTGNSGVPGDMERTTRVVVTFVVFKLSYILGIKCKLQRSYKVAALRLARFRSAYMN